ncbi:DUF2000 family protein [Streptomyces albidoflavus]
MTDVQWDTKIAVIVRDDLAGWQRVNVTAFLTAGIVHAAPEVVGAPYTFADGVVTAPMLQQPVFVFQATPEKMQTLAARAVRRDVTAVVYPDSIFATNNDADNRATVAGLPFDQVAIAGIAVRGESREIDRVIRSVTSRHP